MTNNPFGKLPGGLGDLMKELPKAMANAKQVENELDSVRVEGQSGGGAVKVVMTGKADVVEIKIAKTAVDPEDVETLEDLITLAVREAISKANEAREQRINSILPQGMRGGMPGLF